MMRLTAIFVALALGSAVWTIAQASRHHAEPDKGDAASALSNMTEGEVRKVDKDTGKITLRHGPLTHLDMPAMTMVFQVKDPSMLDRVKAGDKVRFAAEKQNGAFTVVRIEQAK